MGEVAWACAKKTDSIEKSEMIAENAEELKTLSQVVPLATFLPRRYRPGSLGNWSGHLAFANDLVGQFRPSLFVELGTHYGESYFGFCQSVLENGVDCVCYAVDHWHGEEHAGFYGEEVFADVSSYNSRFYKNFSYLLRSSFDDAVAQFSDTSIDLLHIDGLHTYEAGSHDFRNWLPKVREGGIILLHDVLVRHADFGIWKLWQELEAEFPETFAFHHDWGLGVLRKPGASSRNSGLLDALFDSSKRLHEYVRRYYVLYSAYMERALTSAAESATTAPTPLDHKPEPTEECRTRFQVFPFDGEGYSEANSLQQEIEGDRWHTLVFDLAGGALHGPIRLDPADRPCIVELDSIEITDASSGKSIWSATNPEQLKALYPAHAVVFLPDPHNCLILSYGSDPQLQLPDIDHHAPVRLTIRVKIDSGLDLLAAALTANPAEAAPSTGNPEPPVTSRAPELTTTVKVYAFNATGYSEQEAVSQEVRPGAWTTLTFTLTEKAFTGPVRIDVGNQPGIIEIGRIKVSDAHTGALLADFRDPSALRQIHPLESLMIIPSAEKYLLLCYGTEPKMQLSLPRETSGTCRLEISLRVEHEAAALAHAIAVHLKGEQESQNQKQTEESKLLKLELKAAQSERLVLAAEVSQLANDKRNALREHEELLEATRRIAEQHEVDRSGLISEINQLEKAVENQREIIRGVERSLSWRVTAPVRKMMEALRGQRNGGRS